MPAATLLLASCKSAPPADATPAEVAVAVASVRSARVAGQVVATGTYGSRDDIPLSFKTGGVISQILVDQGQHVRKGQTLAALDVREIDAMLAKARVALDKATRDEARAHRLFDDSVATRTQWQDAISARDAAAADMAATRVNRDYAVIVAPQDGIVLQRTAMPGSTIGAGSPVLVLGGAARGRVLRAGLPDRDAIRTRVGDVATVRFDALPGRAFSGKVTLLSGSADARTGTYTVEIALHGADELPAGLVGHADIAVRATDVATLVPVDALVEADSDSATVLTITSDSVPVAQAHRVRIGALHGDHAAVAGLPENATVITRGAPYVTAGTRVRVVEREGTRTVARIGSEKAP
jgi:membrane fusion protein, multidrug efflux system